MHYIYFAPLHGQWEESIKQLNPIGCAIDNTAHVYIIYLHILSEFGPSDV